MSDTKRALLIGCNYIKTPNELYGCINDIIQIKGILIDVYGFSPNDIITLRDDDPSNRPTKAKIIAELSNLVQSNAQYVYLHYSGHGVQIGDKSGDEQDRADECIVPCDYASAGIISDDELNTALKGLKGTGIAVFDCCHSGTILDFPFNGTNTVKTGATVGGLYCLGGCTDSQLASETFSYIPGLPQGAMTDAFITVLRNLRYYPTVDALWKAVIVQLRNNGFSQVPQLSSNIEVTLSTPFPYPDPNYLVNNMKIAITNTNAQIATLQTKLVQLTILVTSLQTQNKSYLAQIDQLKKANASKAPTTAKKDIVICTDTDTNALKSEITLLKQQIAILNARLREKK